MSVSQIDKILKDPFYYGIMRRKGQLYPHIYKPLISRELFLQCEKVREGRSKIYSKETKKDYIFKGLIKCKNCGCSISPETKKNKYVYLRPNSKSGCNCKQINEEKALKIVSNVLESIHIPDNLLTEMKSILKTSLEAKQDFNTASINHLRKQSDAIQRKLDNLLDIRIEGSITKDEYDQKANSLRTEQYNISVKMQKINTADEEFVITLEYLLNIASRANQLFKSSGIDKKRKILNLVFSNFYLNGSKLEYTIKKPFDMLIKTTSCSIALGRKDSPYALIEPKAKYRA